MYIRLYVYKYINVYTFSWHPLYLPIGMAEHPRQPKTSTTITLVANYDVTTETQNAETMQQAN